MKEISVALIGFGLSGRVFHYPFLNELDEFKLVSIYSSKLDQIKALNSEIRVTQNLDDIFDDKSIDLIINAAPNEYHYTYTKRALEAGKNVLVEKPFVVDSAKGQELIELADEKELVLTVFHNRRLDADFQTVKKIIKNKTLGDLKLFESHFDRMRPSIREGRWKESPGVGSGILYDLGVHLIDQVLNLFGTPDSVYADLDSQKNNEGVIDYFHIILKFNKMRVILNGSSFTHLSPRFHLQGTIGQYLKHGLDKQEELLSRGASPSDKNFGIEEKESWGSLVLWDDTGPREISCQSERGEYIKFYQNLALAINGEDNLIVTAEQALEAIKLIELCSKSHELGQTIVLTK